MRGRKGNDGRARAVACVGGATIVWLALGSTGHALVDGVESGEARASQDASDEATTVAVGFRVTTVLDERRARIDRGSTDGLEVGDAALVFRPDGGRERGRLESLDERSAVVLLERRVGDLRAGLRGEVSVPAERFASADDGTQPEGTPTDGADVDGASADGADGADGADDAGGRDEAAERGPSIWEYEDDDGFTEDMPLLAGMRPVRPDERAPFVVGRVFVAADGRFTSDDGRGDHFVRMGTDLAFENPFGNGGLIDTRVEWDFRRFERPELDDLEDTEFRVERLSYAIGGTRFDRDRFAGGRFLQQGAPEFGVLDGFEWSRSASEFHAFGASVGFMPEPDAEYESGEDFQLAGWYRWTSDASEQAAVRVGFQKSWHDGAADRDLIVATGHWLPRRGWSGHATLWIDLYSSGDELKGAGPEITRAYLTATPDTARSYGFDLTYAFQRYPFTERDDVLQAGVEPERIAGERIHRFSVDGWVPWREDLRAVGRAGLWNDSDADGGDVELGVEAYDPWWRIDDARAVLFLAEGEFTNVWGARVDLASGGNEVGYDLFYEFANYDQRGFDDDNDDFVQQRLRATVTWRPRRDLSIEAYLDGTIFNAENGVTAGVFTQWTF